MEDSKYGSAVRKAVICVFDGLRPDKVDASLTPNLWRFANNGVWLKEARSVFPSVTRVATTSFATGAKPTTHGIVNNAFFHLDVVSDTALDTSRIDHLSAADLFHKGRFIEAKGLGCALASAGKRYCVVHSGSAGSAYLVNHRAAHHGHWTYSLHGRDATQTPRAADVVFTRFGPAPKSDGPKTAEANHATDVFVDHVLATEHPDVALIWFSEPDTSYHYRQIGSDDADRVTSAVDACFGRIVDALARSPDADQTAIIALSDHGQISMNAAFDLHAALRERGFAAHAKPGGDVEVLATFGVSSAINLVEPDARRHRALAEALMSMPETGMLFSRTGQGAVPGTLPYNLVGLDHSRAPDLFWVARSNLEPDHFGLPGNGLFTGGTGVSVGGGMHGGLNRHELNTLLAFGGARVPQLGQIHDAVDLTSIVPTLLALLGVPQPAGMTGKPIAALLGRPRPESQVQNVDAAAGAFAQRLVLDTGANPPVVLSGERTR